MARKKGLSGRAIGALGFGAVALLILGSQRNRTPDKYMVPGSDWGQYRDALEAMSRRNYSREEIDRIIKYLPLVEMYAQQYGISPALVAAICHVESRFRPDAESPAGAQGMMQIMPGTWADVTQEIGVSADPLDPKANIQVGTYYIDWLISIYQGEDEWQYKAIAAYNWGIGNVKKSVRDYGTGWKNRLPGETSAYLDAVVRSWNDFEDAFRIAFERGK